MKAAVKLALLALVLPPVLLANPPMQHSSASKNIEGLMHTKKWLLVAGLTGLAALAYHTFGGAVPLDIPLADAAGQRDAAVVEAVATESTDATLNRVGQGDVVATDGITHQWALSQPLYLVPVAAAALAGSAALYAAHHSTAQLPDTSSTQISLKNSLETGVQYQSLPLLQDDFLERLAEESINGFPELIGSQDDYSDAHNGQTYNPQDEQKYDPQDSQTTPELQYLHNGQTYNPQELQEFFNQEYLQTHKFQQNVVQPLVHHAPNAIPQEMHPVSYADCVNLGELRENLDKKTLNELEKLEAEFFAAEKYRRAYLVRDLLRDVVMGQGRDELEQRLVDGQINLQSMLNISIGWKKAQRMLLHNLDNKTLEALEELKADFLAADAQRKADLVRNLLSDVVMGQGRDELEQRLMDGQIDLQSMLDSSIGRKKAQKGFGQKLDRKARRPLQGSHMNHVMELEMILLGLLCPLPQNALRQLPPHTHPNASRPYIDRVKNRAMVWENAQKKLGQKLDGQPLNDLRNLYGPFHEEKKGKLLGMLSTSAKEEVEQRLQEDREATWTVLQAMTQVTILWKKAQRALLQNLDKKSSEELQRLRSSEENDQVSQALEALVETEQARELARRLEENPDETKNILRDIRDRAILWKKVQKRLVAKMKENPQHQLQTSVFPVTAEKIMDLVTRWKVENPYPNNQEQKELQELETRLQEDCFGAMQVLQSRFRTWSPWEKKLLEKLDKQTRDQLAYLLPQQSTWQQGCLNDGEQYELRQRLAQDPYALKKIQWRARYWKEVQMALLGALGKKTEDQLWALRFADDAERNNDLAALLDTSQKNEHKGELAQRLQEDPHVLQTIVQRAIAWKNLLKKLDEQTMDQLCALPSVYDAERNKDLEDLVGLEGIEELEQRLREDPRVFQNVRESIINWKVAQELWLENLDKKSSKELEEMSANELEKMLNQKCQEFLDLRYHYVYWEVTTRLENDPEGTLQVFQKIVQMVIDKKNTEVLPRRRLMNGEEAPQ